MSKTLEPIPFVKDRFVLLLGTVDVAIVALMSLSVILRLRSHDFKIPVQYVVNDGSVLQTSQWFSLYSIVIFVVLSGAGKIILAQRIHKSERNYALVALLLFAIFGIFGLLITNALLGLVAQV